VSDHFDLNMMYYLEYHVMFCMCDDNDNYKC
jgi:hypothetical protein